MKLFTLLLLSATLLFSAVDMNNASKTELMTLKGIGSKKAESIINYRNKHCFKSVKALTAVKGIGAKFIEKNAAAMKVGACKK